MTVPRLVIPGRHAVLEALAGRWPLETVLLAAEAGEQLRGPLAEVVALAADRGVPVQRVPRGRLDQLAGGAVHQGVVALAPPRRPVSLAALAAGPAALVVVLDGVQDPRNLGAILRTAAAAGASGAVVGRHAGSPLTGTAHKAAAGAALRLPVVEAANLAAALDHLRSAGLRVVGADVAGATAYYESSLAGPLALVLGGEARGLRPSTRAHCDELVRIPMPGPVQSLNVSVASGVLLFEALRQRVGGH